MTAWPWITACDDSGNWTTTCKGCGDESRSPYHSQIEAFRHRHECPTEERN